MSLKRLQQKAFNVNPKPLAINQLPGRSNIGIEVDKYIAFLANDLARTRNDLARVRKHRNQIYGELENNKKRLGNEIKKINSFSMTNGNLHLKIKSMTEKINLLETEKKLAKQQEHIGTLLKQKDKQMQVLQQKLAISISVDQFEDVCDKFSELQQLHKKMVFEMDTLTKDKGALAKRNDALAKRNDALAKRNGALLAERDALLAERNSFKSEYEMFLKTVMENIEFVEDIEERVGNVSKRKRLDDRGEKNRDSANSNLNRKKRKQCKHNCKNKKKCKHACCK